MMNFLGPLTPDPAPTPVPDPSPPDPSPPALAVLARDLTVQRGPRTVLRGLDFTVWPGKITGLLGPSGCGKSTLMRSLVGTQAGVAGTLEVLGKPAGDASLRSRIGYVTQAPSVYDDLTVRQNLEYFASVLYPGRRHRDVRRENVTRAIDDVALASHADSLAGRLSGGQRSRVSLAVALLGTPELLVLDEPTVGLDPVLRRDLWDLFHRLAADRGATVLVSSHVMDEAERCHRLMLMREGELLAEDTPDDLRTRTHCATVEDAFLHLVDAANAADARTNAADAGPDAPDSQSRSGAPAPAPSPAQENVR
ncbi:ABC transporter ATP-binding protein [Streptomyces sp. NPDC051907]|uniref:ABC transporter ATP-binding protein n=1 Tax=Streptomyces sp. NPDC051907 TaxID=3155284 RepID=UPI00342964DB